MTTDSVHWYKLWRSLFAHGLFLTLLILAAVTHARGEEQTEFDAYTVRFDGFWFYSQPSGSFHGSGSQGRFDLQADVNFNSYSTGGGRAEWKFTHKNHIYLEALPVNQSKQAVLNQTVLFQGATFGAGSLVSGRLESYLVAPGYQYDIIRRRRGHLGIAAQVDLFYVKGTLKAAAQTVNGTQFAAQASSATIRAPLPVAGPDFRFYLIPNSSRLFVDGNVLGMYFFGYGNFVSSAGNIGFTVNRHLNFQGGYQLSSRFDIKSRTNRIGLNLTQRGAIAGLEVSF